MKTLKDLTREIGINHAYLISLISNTDKMYSSYYITKRSGKKRPIDAPNFELKAIQSWILRNILEKISISERAYGFVKGKGIKNNARIHLNNKYILTIDILDFFNSIKIEKIIALFSKRFKNIELINCLSKLCVYKKYLPQGAVTSPALSNIIFKPIDDEIEKLCNKKNINYSRYADDLSFSSNDFLKLKEILNDVTKTITKHNFKINKKKTRYLSGKYKMSITGLCLNSGKITVGRERKRNLRASIFNYIVKKDIRIEKKVLIGNLAFLRDIEFNSFQNMIKYKNKLKRKFNLD